MKHSVGLFSVLVFILAIVNFHHTGATAQDISNIIFSIAWSPDGSKIAVGKFARIEILDANDLTLLTTLTTKHGAISAVDWSSDGSKIAAASGYQGGLNVWNIASGEIIAARSIDAIAVKWNSDQVRIVSASAGGGIGIWNIATDEVVLPSLFGSTMDWSPDGSKLVSASYDEAPIVVTDITTGETLFTVSAHTYGVEDVDWSPDGTKIASGGPDNMVKVWDAVTGESLISLEGHSYLITSVAWSPNNRRLATGSGDETLRFWDSETGVLIHTVEAGEQVRAISWSPDGSQLVYGGENGIVHVVSAPQLQTSTPSTTIQSEAQTLRDLLSDPECQLACFMGIEPGVTMRADLEAILRERDIPFEVNDIGTRGLITSYTFDANSPSPFIINGEASVGVLLGGDRVEQVDFNVAGISAGDVVMMYGPPTQVQFVGSNVLLYPDLGLVFFASETDSDAINLVYLRTKAGVVETFSDGQPCQGTSSVCTIETATPAAAIQNPSLQNIFHSPTCQSACFMGIKPGITTQAELETLLDQNQLEFTQSSIASGHLILYSVSTSPATFLADDKPVYIDVTADLVDLITVFLQDVTLSQITAAFGAPDAIVGSGGGSNFIIYVAEGLVFATKSADTDSIGLVFLTPPGRDALRINSYLSDFAPCSGSVTVCGVATAIPTP